MYMDPSKAHNTYRKGQYQQQNAQLILFVLSNGKVQDQFSASKYSDLAFSSLKQKQR
jgi:hypothetical protein